MGSVYANKRLIVHKGDGLVETCPVPDVCKTPSPAGPVPVPYVNIANDSDLADGTTSVKIENNPVAIKSSNLKMSSGDEGGTAGGGVVSSKIKGKMTWAVCSADVKFEGEGVIRFLDTCLHNGNSSNSGGEPNQGQPTDEELKLHRKGKSKSKRGKHEKGKTRKLQKYNDKKRQKPGWQQR